RVSMRHVLHDRRGIAASGFVSNGSGRDSAAGKPGGSPLESRSRRRSWDHARSSVLASTESFNWLSERGAITAADTAGFASTHARATCAMVVPTSLAIVSTAERTASPRAVLYRRRRLR